MSETVKCILAGGLVIVCVAGEFVGCQIAQLQIAHDSGYCYAFKDGGGGVSTWMPCEGGGE